MRLYPLLYRHVLARVDPEDAHALGLRALAAAGALPVPPPRLDPCLRVRALGLEWPGPLGAAAGLDKNAEAVRGLALLGFGFVEVGTVTARPQGGNERPRVFRLADERALVNRMGFPNAGADAVATRLARARPVPVGVNVGRSREAEDAAVDYRTTVARLAPLADYLVLNVSSPNTPGLRDLQRLEPLAALVEAVRAQLGELGVRVPLLVKIAPDLHDDHLDAIAELALRLGLDGLVAANTTLARPGLDAHAAPRGGLSGPPLRPRALELLGRLRARVGERVVLVSAGGVESAEDVLERVLAGATLVQAYTGFVHGGPLWPARVHRRLAELVRERGAASIGELVGAGAE